MECFHQKQNTVFNLILIYHKVEFAKREIVAKAQISNKNAYNSQACIPMLVVSQVFIITP